jgi:predicted RNA-binding protein associated with RNAse of E/G family
MREQITVHKLDHLGQEVLTYDGQVLRRTPTQVTLQATYQHRDMDIQDLALRKGDRFEETFYFDRWYNVFVIRDPGDNTLKGWYCNITRPARLEGGHLYAEDLALDLVVHPDQRYIVLDQLEFDRLDLVEEDREQALKALKHLQGLVEARRPPFVDRRGPPPTEGRQT